MKIALGSESAIKVAALTTVAKSFNPQAEIVTVKASSGVNAQPWGQLETYQGALSRAEAAFIAVPDADVAIGLESGLFPLGASTYDRAFAVAIVNGKKGPQILSALSAPLKLPTPYVKAARDAGFATTTVGQKMAEAGVIQRADDPHANLSGISREIYLGDVLMTLFNALREDKYIRKTPEAIRASLLQGNKLT